MTTAEIKRVFILVKEKNVFNYSNIFIECFPKEKIKVIFLVYTDIALIGIVAVLGKFGT